jgi:hypothetical protein
VPSVAPFQGELKLVLAKELLVTIEPLEKIVTATRKELGQMQCLFPEESPQQLVRIAGQYHSWKDRTEQVENDRDSCFSVIDN